MRIDGKTIAEEMLRDLTQEATYLKAHNIVPTLAVILVGDNPASLSYIKQKQKAADQIGGKLILKQLPITTTTDAINETIQQCNNDSSIHGIIIQRPIPTEIHIDQRALNTVTPNKDVDGFMPNSPFEVPVAQAVTSILRDCFQRVVDVGESNQAFEAWKKTQQVVVIGRGETAGGPISKTLLKHGWYVDVVHSQTPNPDSMIKTADILISCVGKSNVVRRDNVKKDAVLISVGIWRDAEDKLHGDYEEDSIKDITSFYTPTPGGVGPVNVACLMQNLVLAANKLIH